MTPAHAAQYAQVAVKTILRAVRGGELPVAGHVGRSPRISRDALDGWLATRSPPAAPVSRQPRRRCGRKASEAVEAAGESSASRGYRETRNQVRQGRLEGRVATAGGGGPRESRTFDREADAKAFAADIRLRARLGHLAGIDSWKVTLDSYVSDTLNLDTYGHVMDELDHAPRLAAVDAIMQARSGPPPSVRA